MRLQSPRERERDPDPGVPGRAECGGSGGCGESCSPGGALGGWNSAGVISGPWLNAVLVVVRIGQRTVDQDRPGACCSEGVGFEERWWVGLRGGEDEGGLRVWSS
jgi:hypothetical protein